MREHRFKAWDKTHNEWYMGGNVFHLEYSGKYGDFYFDNDHPHNMRDVALVWVESTGLHDRHRKEIWEGDKVRFLRKQGYWSHDKGDVEVVKYITDPQAQYCGFGFSALHPLTSRKAKKIEVIGNIFEGGE